MSDGAADKAPETAEDVRAMFARKVAFEIHQADLLVPGSDATPMRGPLLASVLCVKGLPGPAEASGGAAMSGADGEAASKALIALGYREEDLCYALSRPVPGAPRERVLERLRHVLDSIDPLVVVAVDGEAGQDCADALGIGPLVPGTPVVAEGRRVVALDGLERCLGDPALKRQVWRQFQAAAPAGPIY